MKTKITPIISTAILLSISAFSIASAEELGIAKVGESSDIKVKVESNVASSTVKVEINNDSTSTEKRNNNSTSTEANDNGRVNAEEHRSTVASFVKSLLNVANREGGIGDEVRVIAHNQNDSATTTISAIAEVENRGAVRTFFFGSDYKNLGVIRSELATTTNNIAKLKSLLNQTINNSDKVELNAQIQVLEAEHAKMDTYVTAHENVFSLFGWFNKLFTK